LRTPSAVPTSSDALELGEERLGVPGTDTTAAT
jgi:hypothetical protein